MQMKRIGNMLLVWHHVTCQRQRRRTLPRFIDKETSLTKSDRQRAFLSVAVPLTVNKSQIGIGRGRGE